MPPDPRTITAANNNADLYVAMFAAHGLRHTRKPYAFVGHDRPPPFYSNLTVLAPDQIKDVIHELTQIAREFPNGMGLKDSFCQLDLTANGFKTLFEASWIWRAPVREPTPQNWHRIDTDADLKLWEDAWKATGSPTDQRMFKSTMLDLPDFHFLGHRTNGSYQAGCIANVSNGCIGLSNVFSTKTHSDFFAQAAAAAGAINPTLPLAGYESGDTLRDVTAAGFDLIGDLRILVSRSPRF